MKLIERIRARLIDDARAEWKKASTWLASAGTVIFGFIEIFPGWAKDVWNNIPDDLRAQVPHQSEIALGLMAAITAAKFIKQRKDPCDGA